MGGHGGRGRDGGRPLTLGSERVRAGKPFSSIICGAHAPADKKPTSLLATVAERDDNASPTSSKHLVFFFLPSKIHKENLDTPNSIMHGCGAIQERESDRDAGARGGTRRLTVLLLSALADATRNGGLVCRCSI